MLQFACRRLTKNNFCKTEQKAFFSPILATKSLKMKKFLDLFSFQEMCAIKRKTRKSVTFFRLKNKKCKDHFRNEKPSCGNLPNFPPPPFSGKFGRKGDVKKTPSTFMDMRFPAGFRTCGVLENFP